MAPYLSDLVFRINPVLRIAILSHRGVREIRLGRQLIPVDRYGRFFINYLGPSGAFTQYSAADVWEGRLPEGALKDKLVLVGATATGIYDLRVTPFSGICPGIEIEATLCDNVLRNNYLRFLPYAPVPTLLIVVFLGIFLGVMLPRFSAAWAFVLTLYLLIGYVIVNYLLFRYSGVILELFYPLLEVVLVSTR